MLSAMVSNIVPTVFELGLVSTLLVSTVETNYFTPCSHKNIDFIYIHIFILFFKGLKCGLVYSLLSISCVGIYGIFTLAITQWRTKFRVYMNQAENEAGNKAIDSLINYETVKVYTYIFLRIINIKQ